MDPSKNLCVVCEKSSIFCLSCNHGLCKGCAEELVKTDKYNYCPKCDNYLDVDIKKLFTDYANNNNEFVNGDAIWCYSGANSNWWSFTPNQCKLIENNFQLFLDETELNEMKLTVSIGSIYTLNFENMTQSSFNDNTKKRNLKRFEFKSSTDFTDNNVVGIAGKKF